MTIVLLVAGLFGCVIFFITCMNITFPNINEKHPDEMFAITRNSFSGLIMSVLLLATAGVYNTLLVLFAGL